MSGAVHTPREAELLRALEVLAGAASATPNFASPLVLKGAFEVIAKAPPPPPDVNEGAREALKNIEYLTHTHCTQKYALNGVDAIRMAAREAIAKIEGAA